MSSKAKEFSILPAQTVRDRLKTPTIQIKENKLPENPGGNKFFGKTPKYLNKFMQEKEKKIQKEQDQEDSDKNIPDGYKILDDHERLETLSQLRNALKDIHLSVGKGPLRPDSITSKN